MSPSTAARPEAGSVDTIRHALDLGITLFDTSEAYGPFENENSSAASSAPTGTGWSSRRSSPPTSLLTTCKPIGLDWSPGTRTSRDRPVPSVISAPTTVDLWYLQPAEPERAHRGHRPAHGEAVTAGKGPLHRVSRPPAETLAPCARDVPDHGDQSEYSLFERDPSTTASSTTASELVSDSCRSSPLGRGFLSGTITRKERPPRGDARRNLPRFSDEAIDANLRVVEALKSHRQRKNVTTAQLALAWLIQAAPSRSPDTTKASRVEETSPQPTSSSPSGPRTHRGGFPHTVSRSYPATLKRDGTRSRLTRIKRLPQHQYV